MSEPLDIPGLMPYPSVPMKFMPVDDVWSAEYRRVWLSIMQGDATEIPDVGMTGARMLGAILGCLLGMAELTAENIGLSIIRHMGRLANDIASDAADEAARVALNKLESEDAE